MARGTPFTVIAPIVLFSRRGACVRTPVFFFGVLFHKICKKCKNFKKKQQNLNVH